MTGSFVHRNALIAVLVMGKKRRLITKRAILRQVISHSCRMADGLVDSNA